MGKKIVMILGGTSCLFLLIGLLAGCGGGGGGKSDPEGPFLMGGAIQGVELMLSQGVSTFAGTAGAWGNTDGTGAAARFAEPYGVTTDGTNLYVAENNNNGVRKIVIATGEVTTLVEDGMNEPVGITTDGSYAYVCDSGNNAIRKINLSDGAMTLLAGGTSGANDGTGAAAQFQEPYGITTDGTDLYVADRRNHTIRKITSTGIVTTFAGQAGVSGSVNGIGTTATFNEPMSITTDGQYLYVGDWGSFTIRKIDIATREVTKLAGTNGAPGATASTLYGPRGLTTDGISLYVADFYMRHNGVALPGEPVQGASLIRKVNLSTGEISTIAGRADEFGSEDNASGMLATFEEPSGITTDGFSLFIADRQNVVIRTVNGATQQHPPGDLTWENVITRTGHFSFGIKSDGTLWAWGANSDGQLGIGDTTLRRVPVKVDNSSWKDVAIGTNGSNSKPFILAVKTDGTLWAWGDNEFGQLGNGTTTSSNIPVQIGNATDWTAVAAAYSNFSVALKSNGTYWHWGLLSSSGAPNSQIPVQFGTDTDWSKVAAGQHVMAIKTNGTLWGWGHNGNGQVGNATTVGPVTTPYQIQPGQTWLDVSVNASSSHALRSDHTLWSWGYQGYGSLGQETDGGGSGNVTSPGQIGTDSNWASVSSGDYNTIAIKTNGSLWGWGWNISSAIGDGTDIQRVSPVPIGIATDWASVAVGTYHGLGLTTNGTLWGWGDNNNGQLGDTLQAVSTTPRLITPDL